MLWKFWTQYASKFGKLSSGCRTGKGQFSFQSQRKRMPKNIQTTTQLHSSQMLAKIKLKILQGRLQQYVNRELTCSSWIYKRQRNNRSNCQHPLDHWKSKKVPEKHLLLLYCGEGNGTPLQYSCLENPMDGGAWWAAVHGVAKSRARLKWLSNSSRSSSHFFIDYPKA